MNDAANFSLDGASYLAEVFGGALVVNVKAPVPGPKVWIERWDEGAGICIRVTHADGSCIAQIDVHDDSWEPATVETPVATVHVPPASRDEDTPPTPGG